MNRNKKIQEIRQLVAEENNCYLKNDVYKLVDGQYRSLTTNKVVDLKEIRQAVQGTNKDIIEVYVDDKEKPLGFGINNKACAEDSNVCQIPIQDKEALPLFLEIMMDMYVIRKGKC